LRRNRICIVFNEGTAAMERNDFSAARDFLAPEDLVRHATMLRARDEAASTSAKLALIASTYSVNAGRLRFVVRRGERKMALRSGRAF
jgi:hypothetical protein